MSNVPDHAKNAEDERRVRAESHAK